MRSTIRRLLVAAVAIGVAAGAGSWFVAGTAGAAAPAAVVHACGVAPAGHARCLAEYRTAAGVQVMAGTPDGYGATDLADAYDLPATGGTGTIGIVDAYGYPNAEADLAAYRSQYGLPACTVASGCLTIVDQDGRTSPLPQGDPGWAVETALDLDMASAGCPTCRIVLVQADDDSFDNLGTAVDTAVEAGASVVSNSYGADEFTGMDADAGYYQHPGVPVLVASGDYGFGPAQFPAVLDSVIAVGGTTLRAAGNDRGWTERAWSGSGSGCSAWIDKPAWQSDPNCSMRTVADVSAVADPNTGVAVYDSYRQAGWLVVGGTSASSPLVAGIITLAGDPSSVSGGRLYGEPGAFHDVVGGSTGYCGRDYLCTGVKGYDAPTGLGTPKGTTPFA